MEGDLSIWDRANFGPELRSGTRDVKGEVLRANQKLVELRNSRSYRFPSAAGLSYYELVSVMRFSRSRFMAVPILRKDSFECKSVGVEAQAGIQ